MKIKQFILAIAVCSLPNLVNANPFIGLWESVDPDDGGHQVLSITDNGQGGVNLLLFDTYFTLCNGGRGVSKGTGLTHRRTLVSEDYQTYCYDTQTSKTGERLYKINSVGNQLTVDRSSNNLAPVIYHRTDKY